MQKSAISEGDEDQRALERLSRDFRWPLLRYFRRRTTNTADLEDMVQEVFVRLIRRGGTSALARENLSAYVFETASSVLKDRLRKGVTHHVEAHEPFDSDRHSGVDFSPEHVLLNRERLVRATAVLLELPERTRVIFVLRRLEGMRFNDIASRLGISVSAVEKHMQRAITHLMRRVEQE
ncbi:RNA polymerase sigma-70 factor, ECF subfamily [Sphingomonas sp. YR710]|nr:RNA polymerase sigma-70 factor, ECF subfamily [Sphingomonas sp. YR710]